MCIRDSSLSLPESQDMPRPSNPNPYSTSYFTSPQQQQQQQQLPAQLDTSHMTSDSSPHYTSMLHSQLAITSNMCNELLHAQNCLVGAVCSHLEVFGYQAGIQQHHATLCQYQKELEQYYHDLYRNYSQVSTTGFRHNSLFTSLADPMPVQCTVLC